MKNFKFLFAILLISTVFYFGCRNQNKNVAENLETLRVETIGNITQTHLIIVTSSLTGKGCYYIRDKNVVNKFFEKDSLVEQFILTDDNIDDLLSNEYAKDTKNGTLQKPIAEVIACNLLLGQIIYPPGLKVSSLAQGCKAALCNYAVCKYRDKCPEGDASIYKEYACAACAEIPCENIPRIDVRTIKDLKINNSQLTKISEKNENTPIPIKYIKCGIKQHKGRKILSLDISNMKNNTYSYMLSDTNQLIFKVNNGKLYSILDKKGEIIQFKKMAGGYQCAGFVCTCNPIPPIGSTRSDCDNMLDDVTCRCLIDIDDVTYCFPYFCKIDISSKIFEMNSSKLERFNISK